MDKEFKLNDIVVMKKSHACGENKWQITRVGVDVKIKCVHCGREIMMERLEFMKKMKGIVYEKVQED